MSTVRKSKASEGPAARVPSARVLAKREKKRRLILQAVEEICEEQGDLSFSMKDVATRADFAVGALYRYFPNKDALLAATQLEALERLEDHLKTQQKRVVAASGGPPDTIGALHALLEVAFGYVTFGTHDPLGARLLQSMLAAPIPVLDDDAASQAEAAIARVLRNVDELWRSARGDPNVAEIAPLCWAFLVGLSQMQKRDRLVSTATAPASSLFVRGMSALLVGSGAPIGDVQSALQRFAARRI